MKIFDLFNTGAEIAKELVEDKDKKNELDTRLKEIGEQVRIAELNTKTVPWVDALHKMGRQIIAVLNVVVPGVVLMLHPEISLEKIAVIASGGTLLGGLYTALKGKGKQ